VNANPERLDGQSVAIAESIEEIRRSSPGSSGEWIVTMRITDLGWAQRLLMGLGPDVTVVGPPELLERIREQATAALDQYSSPAR